MSEIVWAFSKGYDGKIKICRCLCCKKHPGDTIKIKLRKNLKHITIKKKKNADWPGGLYITWSKDLNLVFEFPKDFPTPTINQIEKYLTIRIPDNYQKKNNFKIWISYTKDINPTDNGNWGDPADPGVTITIGDAPDTENKKNG